MYERLCDCIEHHRNCYRFYAVKTTPCTQSLTNIALQWKEMDHHHDSMKLEYSEACRQNVYSKQWTYFAISISICSQLLPFELNTQCRPHTISFDSVIASTDCLQKVETNWCKRQRNLGVGCLVNLFIFGFLFVNKQRKRHSRVICYNGTWALSTPIWDKPFPVWVFSSLAKHTLGTLVQLSSL